MLLRTLRLPALLASTSLAGALLLSVPTHAGTAAENLDVSATVVANCTISAGTVAFGDYDPIVANKSGALDATGTVTVTCTNGSAVTVTLDQGANADAGSTTAAPLRRMVSGINFLDYALFSDSGYTTVWGATAETDVASTGTGDAVDLTVYGRVAADQQVPVGAYADSVVAEVTF